MIAVLIIAHEPLATALMHCTRHVFKRVPPQLAALDVLPDEDPAALLEGARLLGSRINDGSGLVVLTDLVGATPARIAVQLADPHRVIVFYGVNLPILLKTLTYRSKMPIDELAVKLAGNAPTSLGLYEPEPEPQPDPEPRPEPDPGPEPVLGPKPDPKLDPKRDPKLNPASAPQVGPPTGAGRDPAGSAGGGEAKKS